MNGVSRGLSLKRLAAGGGAMAICPCHMVYGGAALLGGMIGIAAPPTSDLQDGFHALYLVAAGLGVALWLRRASRRHDNECAEEAPFGSR